MPGPTTPLHKSTVVWAVPRSLATTNGMISFPRVTKMFQFTRFPSLTYVFSQGYLRISSGGFPHSEIFG